MRQDTATLSRSNSDSTNFDDLVGVCVDDARRWVAQELRGREEDAGEILGMLLAYGSAMEGLMRSSGKLQGHPSLRTRVEQLVRAESSQIASERLHDYFQNAFSSFAKAHADVERELLSFSEKIERMFRPQRVREAAQGEVSTLQRLFGLEACAYWRHYEQQYKQLDARTIHELGQEGEPEHES